MSNLNYFQNPVYLHHFCVFEIFVRPAKTDETKSVPHPKWLRTYMFAHRDVSWTVEQSGCIFSVTIAGFPILDSAIGNGFLHASVGFRQIIHTSHAEIVCMITFRNGRNNGKTACICLYPVRIAKFASTLFLAQTWGKTSQHHVPGFRQTVIVWRRSWHCCIWDCFPGAFPNMQRCVVEE